MRCQRGCEIKRESLTYIQRVPGWRCVFHTNKRISASSLGGLSIYFSLPGAGCAVSLARSPAHCVRQYKKRNKNPAAAAPPPAFPLALVHYSRYCLERGARLFVRALLMSSVRSLICFRGRLNFSNVSSALAVRILCSC